MDGPRPDAPWPIEQVHPRDLAQGDVVKVAEHSPWVQVTRIVDAGKNQPEWEKPYGSRMFVLGSIDAAELPTMFLAENEVRVVWRRIRGSE